MVANSFPTNIDYYWLYLQSIRIFWMIFNEGAYSTYIKIFHKALNLFKFDCEITPEELTST